MRLTLDHNCLIDLESGDADNQGSMRQLVRLHEAGRVTLQVSAISGSELMRGKRYATTFNEFQERLLRLSVRNLTILPPMIYLDISFYDWSMFGGGDGSAETLLEQEIHAVLFPRHEFRWIDQAAASCVDPDVEAQNRGPVLRDWRNRKCDVVTMWCHIYHGGDVFVTSDNHFHNRGVKQRLVDLGARAILRPVETLTLLLGC
jgi:hypothetical protein